MKPKLRFVGFSDDWEKKTLGDIGEIRMCKRIFNSETNQSGGIPFYKIGTFGKSADAFIDEQLYRLYRKKYKFPKEGEILISAAGTLGRRVRYNGENAYYQDSNIVWIENDEEHVLNDFLYHLYEIVRFESEGGTIQRLYNPIIKRAEIIVPDLVEQFKISRLLDAIDHKINLLTKKKQAIETYKKGLIQKIFSQELRFKRGDGTSFVSWEERSLSTCLRNVIVPMRDKPKEFGGSIDWCRIEDIKRGYINGSIAGLKVSANCIDQMNLKVLPIGSVIVSCSAYLGICARVTKPLITNQTFIGLVPDSDITTDFLYYAVSSKERVLNRLSSGTTISYLSRSEFEDLKVQIPCIDEQDKITGILNFIDVSIELVESQIEMTKNLKKGLLQQMFV